MTYINTLGNRLKRGLLKFSEKVSKGLPKPARKFVAEMVYGIAASNSCKLTEIGRALKEDIPLKKSVDRLSRNLANFSHSEIVMNNLVAAVRPSLGSNTMLLLDPSDVTKPCSPKMEAIGKVYDASTGKFAQGYWTMGVVALTEENQQPVPVYERLYPCKKQGGAGGTEETKKALQHLREHFGPEIPRVLDRGFDAEGYFREFFAHDEKFILRQNQNRVAIHHGKRTCIDEIVRGLDCTHELSFRGKYGLSKCRIGMTTVALPNMGNLKMNLAVCKGIGAKPLALYTNLDETLDTLAVRVVKAYLMRWRIEEFYAFKKQALHFEDFRVRGLKSIQALDLLLTIAAAYIGLLSANASSDPFVVRLIQLSKRVERLASFLKNTKFFYYALADAVSRSLACLNPRLSRFYSSPSLPSPQLCFADFVKMG
ncbi:MAG: hypothetical protein FWH26_07600 [Oscillospiraceae bacterium]|nr:hypothetical protein [Oscillospiraceae bacterium]